MTNLIKGGTYLIIHVQVVAKPRHLFCPFYQYYQLFLHWLSDICDWSRLHGSHVKGSQFPIKVFATDIWMNLSGIFFSSYQSFYGKFCNEKFWYENRENYFFVQYLSFITHQPLQNFLLVFFLCLLDLFRFALHIFSFLPWSTCLVYIVGTYSFHPYWLHNFD